MSRRGPSWSAVAIAVGVLTAIAVASPALGGPSLKSLVKKEVAKQISKATGRPERMAQTAWTEPLERTGW